MMSPTLELLQEQLRLAGPPALEMLEGSLALDPLVVFSALEAAGLLDEQGLSADTAELRKRLYSGAHDSAVTRTALDQLDVRPEAVDLSHAADAEDLERRLDGLVALAGVHAALPPSLSSRTLGVLERNVTWLELHPSAALPILSAAEAHQSSLDLPAVHPVHSLLEAVLEAELEGARPVLPVDWKCAWQQAERALFPPRWAVWAARLGEGFAALRQLLERPADELTPALAATDASEDESEPIARRGDEELVIRRAGRGLQLGWAGPGPAPSEAKLGERVLEEGHAPAPGTAVWWLPAPPEGEAAFVLRWTDREWRVVLGEERR